MENSPQKATENSLTPQENSVILSALLMASQNPLVLTHGKELCAKLHKEFSQGDTVTLCRPPRTTELSTSDREEIARVLSWLISMIDLYDDRLAKIDGPETVYTPVHLEAKKRANAAWHKLTS